VEEASYVRFLVIKRIKADKLADESFVRMFKDEARISAELHHGNIAQVYDFGRQDDEYYLVIEFIPGLDVRRIVNLLRDRGLSMPLRVALRITCDILEALQYAHTRIDPYGTPMHIVHRDVNPRNMMVSTRGDVKLIDFGVAKATDRLEHTRTDTVKGKFAYMAPEQVAGESVDHRADLFASALTLHEMVAGYGPFHGLTQVQIMHRLVNGSIPDLPTHPDAPNPTPLRRIQRRALATSPQDRYPDCKAYQKELERFAESLGGLATREEMVQFLFAVDRDLEDRLRRKMSVYAGPIALVGPTPMAVDDPPPAESSGSMSRLPEPAHATGTTSLTVTRGVVVGGGLALFAAVGAVFLVLTAVAVTLIVTAQVDGGTPDPAFAAPVVSTAAGTPVPAPVETDADGAGPGTSEPVSPPSAPPAPAAQRVAAAPRSGEPTTAPGRAGAVTVEASVPTGASEPTVGSSEAPAVVSPPPRARSSDVRNPWESAATPGFVDVGCGTAGLTIRIDGEATAFVTGDAPFSWSAGRHSVQVGDHGAKVIDLRSGQLTTVTCD
jgi:serine/threonine-protein kinase